MAKESFDSRILYELVTFKRDERPTFENFVRIKHSLVWNALKSVYWKQTVERKLVYTLGITVQGMVLDSFFLQIASVIFSSVFDVFDVTPFPSVSIANLE